MLMCRDLRLNLRKKNTTRTRKLLLFISVMTRVSAFFKTLCQTKSIHVKKTLLSISSSLMFAGRRLSLWLQGGLCTGFYCTAVKKNQLFESVSYIKKSVWYFCFLHSNIYTLLLYSTCGRLMP